MSLHRKKCHYQYAKLKKLIGLIVSEVLLVVPYCASQYNYLKALLSVSQMWSIYLMELNLDAIPIPNKLFMIVYYYGIEIVYLQK